MRFRRLLPEPGTLTAAEVVRGLTVPATAREERPYLVLNMVCTADGRATVAGRAGPIGNQADRELFHWLRTRTDAVMAGAGTMRVEHYGRLVRDPELRAEREREGLRPDPLAVIVSGRLDLQLGDVPLLTDPQSRVAILTTADDELQGARAMVQYLREEDGALNLQAMLAKLRSRHGVRSILCEGGPTLNGALLAQGLVDELFLSLAPKLASGPSPLTIARGEALPDPGDMTLAWALESEGHLFLRYVLPR
ncbi:MAG: dihydrofolate reductase family protein [Thermoleophilaceae bacterium]